MGHAIDKHEVIISCAQNAATTIVVGSLIKCKKIVKHVQPARWADVGAHKGRHDALVLLGEEVHHLGLYELFAAQLVHQGLQQVDLIVEAI